MRSTGGKKQKRAAAVVEMAVVMPVLFLMLFGIIEFGWMLSVQNNLVSAAREGARRAALQGGTLSDAETAVVQRLTPMNLQEKVNIDLTDATVDEPMVGVELAVPRSDVSLLGNFFGFESGTLRARCWMRKEGM